MSSRARRIALLIFFTPLLLFLGVCFVTGVITVFDFLMIWTGVADQ